MKKSSLKGFAAFWIVVMLAMVPTLVYTATNYTNIINKVKQMTQSTGTRQLMYVAKNMLLQKVKDIDADGTMELLAHQTDPAFTLPSSIAARTADEWGSTFIYCSWDQGAANGVDPLYATYTGARPTTDPIGRIISEGKNRNPETSCSDESALGDDIVVDIFESDALSATSGISGWADDGSLVRLITPTDEVEIGDIDSSVTTLKVWGQIRAKAKGGAWPVVSAHTGDGDWSPHFIGYSCNGGLTTCTQTTSGQLTASLGGRGHDGTDFAARSMGAINVVAGEDYTPTAQGTKLSFRTTPINSTSDVEVAVLTEAGDFDLSSGGVGLSSYNGTPVAGDMQWNGTNFEGYNGSAWVELDQQSAAPPVGQVSYFASDTCPSGWLKANGSAVSRATYSSLFAYVGGYWGTGDGSTTFNLPDLRGEFMRGWDDGRGADSGRAFASWQDSVNRAHRHASPTFYAAAAGGGGARRIEPTWDVGDAGARTSTGSWYSAWDGNNTEARPRNRALLACIKY